MSKNEVQKQKWISDAAYFNSLKRPFKPEQDILDWLEAERQYLEQMQKRVKSGLVRIC